MQTKPLFRRGAFAAALVLAAVVACDGSPTDASPAMVRILLTDAPADYIESAVVTVSRVYLQGDDSDDASEETASSSRVDLFNDAENPLTFDLMTLRDGIVAELATAEAPTGSYHQLRLVLTEAVVTLIEGVHFRDGSNRAALKTPSAMSSGIKVKLDRELEVAAGSLTELLVDFDVNENFKLQGDPNSPQGLRGVMFKPVLKEKARAEEPL